MRESLMSKPKQLRAIFFMSIFLFILLGFLACDGGGSGGGGDEDGDDDDGVSVLSGPTDLTATVVPPNSIQLNWVDVTEGEEGFEVQMSDDGEHYDLSYTAGRNATSYTIDGLNKNVDYSFRVRAFNSQTESPFSNIVVSVIKSVLDNDYSGTLELRLTNQFPAFDETARADVYLDRYGGLSFGTATLRYDATDDNGELKMQRTGTLSIDPTDGFFNNADPENITIELNENTRVQETIKTWVKDSGGAWKPVADQTFTELWNGGLAFEFDEFGSGGATHATVGVSNAQGSALWTLTLLPPIP